MKVAIVGASGAVGQEFPALRVEPNNTNSSNGKFLSSSTRRNS